MPSRPRKTPPAETPLGDTVEFLRLLWAVDHGLQSTSKMMARSLGVTGPQRLVVRIVARVPGISAGDLADVLHIDPSTLTGILKRLAARGALSRRADPTDRRRITLALTPAGRKLDRRTAGTVEAGVRRALGSLPAADVQAAARVLRQIAHNLLQQARSWTT